MRGPLLVAIGVVAVAGLAVLLWPEADGPDPSVQRVAWHVNETYSFTDRFCGDCHYGLTRMWQTAWTPIEQDNVTLAWELEVAPRWPDADLYAVQVAGSPQDLVLWESGFVEQDVVVGEPWIWSFDVPAGASAVFARLHGEAQGVDGIDCRAAAQCMNDYVTGLELRSPSGDVAVATGPDGDLKLLVVTAPEAGAWQVVATVEGGDLGLLARARAVAAVEVLGGNVTAKLAVSGSERVAVVRVPAGPGGAPPPTWLRVQPQHDHRLYESADWDRYDSSPFVVEFQPVQGPAPSPFNWTALDIDAAWVGDDERVVLERSGRMTVAYVDEPGHNDPGLGGSYPAFGPLGTPVPAGTARIEFELTWTPPTPQPDFGVRFSPAGTPYFFEALELSREPGRALFETAVLPAWWEHEDQVLDWLDPDRVTSYWDIAPRLVEDGGPRVAALDWQLIATAHR